MALEKAAAELAAHGNDKGEADYDRCNQATYLAEVAYLEQVLAACAKFGVRDVGWRTALQTLPRPKSAAEWLAGRGAW